MQSECGGVGAGGAGSEIQSETAGQDGVEKALGFRAKEDEDGIARGLLERFQKCVGRALVHAVGTDDDSEFVDCFEGFEGNGVNDLAHLVDADDAGFFRRVDPKDIWVETAGDAAAGRTFHARVQAKAAGRPDSGGLAEK